MVWARALYSDLWKLYSKKQTLLHCLSNCEVALQLHIVTTGHTTESWVWSGNWLHHTYLVHIRQRLTCMMRNIIFLPTLYQLTSALMYIVLCSDVKKRLYFLELTICFETGFHEAVERKKGCYADLVEGGTEKRLLCTDPSRTDWKQGNHPWQQFRESMRLPQTHLTAPMAGFSDWHSRVATIEESHQIWCEQNHSEWCTLSSIFHLLCYNMMLTYIN